MSHLRLSHGASWGFLTISLRFFELKGINSYFPERMTNFLRKPYIVPAN
jgi:hypothetical protein